MMHTDCYLTYTKCVQEKGSANKWQEDTQLFSGDFESVKEYIKENILETSNAVSMIVLHRIYGTGYGDVNARSYRAKLKSKIATEFKDMLLFLTVDGKSPQVVVSSQSLNETIVIKDKSKILREAAKTLSDNIRDYAAKYDLLWPLSVDSLLQQEEELPASIKNYLSQPLVNSFSSDLIAAVSRVKVVALNYFLVVFGLHNITGLKRPIKILSHLGHCIDYNLVYEVETVQVEMNWF